MRLMRGYAAWAALRMRSAHRRARTTFRTGCHSKGGLYAGRRAHDGARPMRKTLLLLGPLVATAALFACEDSGSGGSSGVFNPDSATFEAPPPSEAGSFDSAVDAAPSAQSVTVSIARAGGVAAGVTVIFHDAAGEVLESKTTGANGKATSSGAVVPAQVSILSGSRGLGNTHIITWTGVEGGDELLVRDTGDGGPAGTYLVTPPAPFAGAPTTQVSIGRCANTGLSPVTVFLEADCVRPSMAILASALGPNQAVLAYAFAKAQPAVPTDGGGAAATLGPWVVPTEVTVSGTNVPESATAQRLFMQIADGLGFQDDSAALGTGTFTTAPGFAEAHQGGILVALASPLGASLVIVKRGAPAASIAVDFATALPAIASAEVVTTTLARPLVNWTTAANAPLTAADGGAVMISWFDRSETVGTWTLIVPPGAKTAKAPAMPAAAGDWLPQGADKPGGSSVFYPPTVLFAEADTLPSYASFRRGAGLLLRLQDPYAPERKATLPANGTLKLSTFAAQR